MKQSVVEKSLVDNIPFDKFNVAWFKLAEFVGRKEKERALGVYKLLSHSLLDDAFAAQLEGDLFMAFHDEKAVDAYQRAAKLYEKNGQLAHAALVYEQMMAIQPENKEYLIQALKLYEAIKNDVKIARCASQLARIMIKNNSLDLLNDLMATLSCATEHQLYVQQACITALIEFQPSEQQLIQDYLSCVVHGLESSIDYQKQFSLFFAKLSALDITWYERACQLLKANTKV